MITTRRALHQYGTVENEARAEYASPYELTKMLFSGAMKSMALIPVLMDRKAFEECSKEVTRSVGIINGLKDSLDLSQGEIAENLFQLYTYMIKELMRAHRNLDQEAVRSVRSLFSEIDEAWSSMPVQFRG